MSKIETLMALWLDGYISEEYVVNWADDCIRNSNEYDEHIALLSLKGPKFCSQMPQYEFPKARRFTYDEELALRLGNLDIENENEKLTFVRWVSGRCMGEDLDNPKVMFGYMVDHLFNECDDHKKANQYLSDQVSAMHVEISKISSEIWANIA